MEGGGDGFGEEDFGAGVAVVLVGVGPVLELGGLVAGAAFVLDGQSLEGVADREGDGVAGGVPLGVVGGCGVGGGGGEQCGECGECGECDGSGTGGAGEAHEDVPLEDHGLFVVFVAVPHPARPALGLHLTRAGGKSHCRCGCPRKPRPGEFYRR
ncbi:hypothetical protein SAV14893_095270 [Streptomyces avermitilis]|uniref:Uncharacterized protein n=1 Tax=Streptomyces avermitilis TaxID=33903 RepID=A0A4D4MEA4_STRAX|nr:hypothetical protein SAV14893_095270 [Streptomyces avermitilis]